MPDFEENDGDITKIVSMLERHLVKSGVFDSNSTPSIEQLDVAVSETEGELYAWLAAAGFSISITDYPAIAKRYLSWYVALGTAYRLELSHPGVQYNPRGNSRWMVLRDQFERIRKILETPALDRLGVVRTRTQLGVITGVSQSEKRELAADADKVLPFFERDGFRHPNRIRGSQDAGYASGVGW